MTPIALLQQWLLELNLATIFDPFLFSFLFLISLLFLFKLTRGTKHNLPPSPPKLPIIGNLHQLGTLPHRSLRALSEKYGPIMLLHLGHVPTVVVSSMEIAKEIMKTHDIAFASRPQMRAAHALFYGACDVGFSPYGEYWRQAKKICVLELLSLKRVRSFQFVRDEEVEELVENIRCSCINGASVNLGEMVATLSYNIVSRAAIGRKIKGKDGDTSFEELARRTTELFGAFCIKDYFPSLGWMDVLTGLVARLKETSKGLDAYLDQVINEHQMLKTDDDQFEKKDFVDILLNLQKEGTLGIDLTLDNLKAIILDMFVGGTDTSSTTIEWTMTELVRNPSTMKKVQEEVRRVVGDKQKVDENDISEMVYLKCVINETLRLHAPVPLLVPRESSASTKLEGYDIPPNTKVYINAWAIQMDPKLWDKPEEFHPERFIDYHVDFTGGDFQFIPFGSGRRGCPGISFAMVEVEFVLANLLYWFDWKLLSGITVHNLDMSETSGLVVHKKNPLHLVPQLHSAQP